MASESMNISSTAAQQAAWSPARTEPSNQVERSVDQQSPQPVSPTQAADQLAEKSLQQAVEQREAEGEGQPLSKEELGELLSDINNALYSMNRNLRFEIHDKTEDLVVRVVNTKTDEIIRQYPSEDVLDRRERLLAGETGVFLTRVD